VAKTGRDVNGLKWEDAAVGNASWAGAAVRDVLALARVRGAGKGERKGMHACFAARAAGECDEDACYEVSVPLEKVLEEGDGGAILAYEVRASNRTGAGRGR
jgi:sulfite oxidase